jgi:hypothetical protein
VGDTDEPAVRQLVHSTQANKQEDSGRPVEPTDLTEKQLKTLYAIYENPDATQTELSDQFGVTPATLNTRVNSIDNFEWTDRQTFVQRMFENNPIEEFESETDQQSTEELAEQIDDLAEQVQTMEDQLSDQQSHPVAAVDSLELTHKVLHACLRSDEITKEEELQILKEAITESNMSI